MKDELIYKCNKIVIKEVQQIFDDVTADELCKKESLTWWSAVIIVYGFKKDCWLSIQLSHALGLSVKNVSKILNNLISNKILVADEIHADFFNEQYGKIEFLMCAMVGAGDITRIAVDESNVLPEADDNLGKLGKEIVCDAIEDNSGSEIIITEINTEAKKTVEDVL